MACAKGPNTSNPRASISSLTRRRLQASPSGPPHLHLLRADVELAEDVAEEVLDLVPGVDAVGAVQHDHNVHVCGAPCRTQEGAGLKRDKRGGV